MASVNGAAAQCQAGNELLRRSEQVQVERWAKSMASTRLCQMFKTFQSYWCSSNRFKQSLATGDEFFARLLRTHVSDPEMTLRRLASLEIHSESFQFEDIAWTFAGAEKQIATKAKQLAKSYRAWLVDAEGLDAELSLNNRAKVNVEAFSKQNQTLKPLRQSCISACCDIGFSEAAANGPKVDIEPLSDTSNDHLTELNTFRARYNEHVIGLLLDLVLKQQRCNEDIIEQLTIFSNSLLQVPRLYVDRIWISIPYIGHDLKRNIIVTPVKLLFNDINSFPVPLHIALLLAVCKAPNIYNVDWNKICRLDFDVKYLEVARIFSFPDLDMRHEFTSGYGMLEQYHQKFRYREGTYTANGKRSSPKQSVVYDPAEVRKLERQRLRSDLRSFFPLPAAKYERRLNINAAVRARKLASTSASNLFGPQKPFLLEMINTKYHVRKGAPIELTINAEQDALLQTVIDDLRQGSIGLVLAQAIRLGVDPVKYTLKQMKNQKSRSPIDKTKVKAALTRLKLKLPWYDPFLLLLQSCRGTQQL
jgi:hypothetical protein